MSGAETKNLILKDQKYCIRGCEEFKYLGVKIDQDESQQNDIKNKVNKGRAITAMLEETDNQKKKTNYK